MKIAFEVMGRLAIFLLCIKFIEINLDLSLRIWITITVIVIWVFLPFSHKTTYKKNKEVDKK